MALLPDRQNIYIDVKECKKTVGAEWLQNIFKHVSEKVNKSKKVIVFCRSIDTASDLGLYSMEMLGEKAYKGGIKTQIGL